jgi:hypothetical protein
VCYNKYRKRADNTPTERERYTTMTTIYTVWTNSEYEPDLLALFTNETAAQECAERNGGRVYKDTAFDTAAAAELED